MNTACAWDNNCKERVVDESMQGLREGWINKQALSRCSDGITDQYVSSI